MMGKVLNLRFMHLIKLTVSGQVLRKTPHAICERYTQCRNLWSGNIQIAI